MRVYQSHATLASVSILHHTSCPLCGETSFHAAFTSNGFSVLDCDACHFRITQDTPTGKAMDPYYDSETYVSHATPKLIDAIRRHYTFPLRKRRIQHWNTKSEQTFLDIGCGNGAFVQYMSEAGWHAQGTETSTAMLDHCVQRGIDVIDHNNIDSLPASSFSAVTIWHVLEHVEDMHETMEHIYRLLVPGGICYIALPNTAAAGADMYGSLWFAHQVPLHRYHFTPETFSQLAEKHNFLLKKTYVHDLDTYYCCLYTEHGKLRALPKALLLHALSLLNRNRASSHSFILQKPEA